MEDVSKELLESALSRLEMLVNTDPTIKAIERKRKDRKTSPIDAANYSKRIAKHTSAALRETLTPDNLPNGVLYWNISNAVIPPVIHKAYDLINSMEYDIQKLEWEKIGIGLIPKKAAYPDERIKKLLEAIDQAEKEALDGIQGEGQDK